ncbi:MAG TPA: peptide-methionine (S)-S-oxide reductase, partial [Chitinophagaceae bacterium]|nr:peptide-methionine (S)-S-oxide reductase [Chitinophagaceae bacterium]
GNDVGTQYRSVVFFHNETQKKVAEAYKTQLNGSGKFKQPIVTTIEPMSIFYP